MIPPIILSHQNLILQSSLALFLTLILSFFNISSLFLHGLHTYIHPDDVSPNNSSQNGGIRAAIRRPGQSDPPNFKIKKKSKDKFEFDESKAQIFRLKLNHNHLETRLYYSQFRGIFNTSIVVFSCFLLNRFKSGSADLGVLANGSIVPIVLGFACIGRVLISIGRVSFERSASKRSEKQLSVLLGISGFLLGLTIVCQMIPRFILDFGFESLDGYVRFFLASFMGCIAGFLFMPAMKIARAFWLGTDQIRSSLSIVSCGWFARMLLFANYVLIVFTSLLWINPWPQLLVNNKNIDVRKRSQPIGDNIYAEELAGNVGMSQLEFEKFRFWCLLISGLLQIVALRPNLQMYLNESLLSWYQRLHASKIPDLDFSRAKVFLHNHYFCLVVLQFLAPPVLVLLFLGLSRIDGNISSNIQMVCDSLPCSALVKEMALFMAWWVMFVWSIFISASIFLHRRGFLYVS